MPRRMPVDLTGSKIGNYRFVRRLGAGGCADVYLADEAIAPSVSRQVAIKAFVAEPESKDRLQRTFDAFATDVGFLIELGPDNPILQYYATRTPEVAVRSDGVVLTLSELSADQLTDASLFRLFLIVMEYADGGSLDQSYRTEVIASGRNNIHLGHFRDICVALQVVHEKGILHRDIKPHNIFYFRKLNKVKLGDFGIAKRVDDIGEAANYLRGSLPYMAPEVFAELQYTDRSDIYALGCTFFELYTGEAPFAPPAEVLRREDPPDIVEAYRECHRDSARPNALRDAATFPSIQLNDLIRRMMDVDPKKRPGLDEVLRVLANERASQTIHMDVAAGKQRPLSSKPVFRSQYIVNPHFRRVHLKEAVFFVFVTLQPRTEAKLRGLFEWLNAYYRDCVSVWEVFGRCDFLIRVWGRGNRVRFRKCVADLTTYVLDGDGTLIRVMVCEDARYLGTAIERIRRGVDVTELLIDINAVQAHRDAAAAKRLLSSGVYIRPAVTGLKKHQVRCFCLVRALVETDEASREEETAMIGDAIRQSKLDPVALDMCLYRKAFTAVDGAEHETSDHVISYLVPSLDEVVQVPDVLHTRLARRRPRTITLLSTRRYVVESDQVMVDQVGPGAGVEEKGGSE